MLLFLVRSEKVDQVFTNFSYDCAFGVVIVQQLVFQSKNQYTQEPGRFLSFLLFVLQTIRFGICTALKADFLRSSPFHLPDSDLRATD